LPPEEKREAVEFGTKKYTATLTPGEYAYACSAHPKTMHGTFVVTPATRTSTSTATTSTG
jgi:plastocyanin